MRGSLGKVAVALGDFAGVDRGAISRELALIESSLFFEEVTGFTLSDDEITSSNLGDVEAMRRFAAAKARS